MSALEGFIFRVAHRLRLRGPLEADPTARTLHVLLWVLTTWYTSWAAILLPFHWADFFWSMPGLILTALGLVSALVILRRGRFRAAAFTYLASVWFFATFAMAFNGGIRSPVQVLYVTLPISAAWLLGYEAAVWLSVVCMSCALVFALLGVKLPHKFQGTPLGAWVIFGMACLIGAVPVAQILRDLRSALMRSREAEEKSQRTTERLETEIDEHKRTEQALRESEQRFRIAADTAPVMIVVRDADQNATFFNKVWLDLTGRSLEQELGMGWAEGVHPNDLDEHLADLSAAFAERKEYHLQFRLRRADGEYRLLLSHGVPRFELDSTFDGYIASCTDITDFKRHEEEALAVQKWESLGVLAGGIAHDFNNLLGGISAQSELLIDELQNSPCREGALRIQSVADRAAEIVRQLMVYAGQESASLKQVDLVAVVRDMLPLVNVSASRNVAIEVDLPEGLSMVRVNVAQIRQVILNLVTNAAEALGGKEGIITVGVTEVPADEFSDEPMQKPPGDHCLRLAVSDTGRGMTEQLRAKIFDPFFSTKGAGRGLGLSAVRGIIRSHGGDISVISSPGRGSRFEILLPCAIPVEQVPSEDVLDPANGAENLTGTVLMIEDENILRGAIAKKLRAKGLHVMEAGDGWTALELFRTSASQIDVVVLDATLPGLSGREVLRRMREVRPLVKAIIASAYGRDRALATVSEGPSQPYIRKPYRVEELLKLIQKICHESELMDT